MSAIELIQKTCQRCGRSFEIPKKQEFIPRAGGAGRDYCRDCTKIIWERDRELNRLLSADLTIERIDEAFARQIIQLIGRESQGIQVHDEAQLRERINKLLVDEQRRLALLKAIQRVS